MENPIKIHDLGGTPIFGNIHIFPAEKHTQQIRFSPRVSRLDHLLHSIGAQDLPFRILGEMFRINFWDVFLELKIFMGGYRR